MTSTESASGSSRSVSSTNGVEVALHHLGGEGPPLLICHATGFHGRAYAPLARLLASTFSVWGADLRGHGDATSPENGDFNWHGMADDVLAVIEAIGEPVVAVGHSMGGASILRANIRDAAAITKAYLYEPIVFPSGYIASRGENPLSGPARRRREVFASRAEAIARYSSRPPLGGLHAGSLHAYVEYGFHDLDDGTVQLACRAADEAAVFEASEMDISECADVRLELTVGAGMVAGSPNPAEFAPVVVENTPGARLITYEHLGHFGPLESPRTVAADILSSLA